LKQGRNRLRGGGDEERGYVHQDLGRRDEKPTFGGERGRVQERAFNSKHGAGGKSVD